MKRAGIYWAVFLLFPSALCAQQAQRTPSIKQVVVQGTVRDSTAVIPFASVYLKNHSTTGVQVGSDGSFVLRADKASLPDTLVFSAVGYRNVHFPLSPGHDTLRLAVRMRQTAVQLQDVVVKTRKNEWKRQVRISQKRFNDALVTSAIHERRFIFRITEIRSVDSPERYDVSPAANYMVIDKDSISIFRDMTGATYTDRRGEVLVVDDAPAYSAKRPVISFKENESKGGIRIDVRYHDVEDSGWVDIGFVFAKNSGTSTLAVTIGKAQYIGYLEYLGYSTIRKDWLQTMYEAPETAAP